MPVSVIYTAEYSIEISCRAEEALPPGDETGKETGTEGRWSTDGGLVTATALALLFLPLP
jgi:hypothetical protein